MKTKRIKRPVCYLVGLLVFGLMLYSCLQDETDLDSRETTGKIIKGKNRELSIDVARSWYEAHQTPVVTTRSVATHFELMTKLHWKKGYENRKGKFEVVEVPLLTRGGAVLMDSETMEKCKDTERGKIRNISRMVIIKNLETGEIINFVMHIVGTYDYLMKAKHFEDNSYLYRAPDLSGSVYFYEPEGGLVNGWQYENGKIVATISQGTEEGLKMQATADTRSESSECHYESVFVEYDECTPFIYEDPEYGIGFGIECRTRTKYETKLVCNNIYHDENGNAHTWFPPEVDSGGGVGGGYQPVAPKAKAIFRNSNMTDNSWKTIENLLDKMTKTKIGEALYHKLQEALKGKTLIIQFVSDNMNSNFDPGLGGIKMRMDITSSALLHEMVHALQSYTEQETWNATQLNREFEAHLIQQIYINSLEESERTWWYEKSKNDSRWNATRLLVRYIDEFGNLRPGITAGKLQKIIPKIISDFRDVGYDNIDCHIVKNGDVMQDAALFYLNRARMPQEIIPSKFVLCTVHRAENTDDEVRLKNIFYALETISEQCPVVLPLHPRTKGKLLAINYDFARSKICFIDPVGYLEMVWLLKNCELVMTDSGGLQKEAYFFEKYCVTMRDETEWVELVEKGFNVLAGSEPTRIISSVNVMIFKNKEGFENRLYGNGDAGEKILDTLLSV